MCEATIGFIGVVIGAIIGLIPYFIERKDRYKFERFKNELMKDLENYKDELERRLEEHKKDLEIKYEVRIKTHQEAFSRLIKIDMILPASVGNVKKYYELGNEMKDWWTKNCFYLDKDSRIRFFQLSEYIRKLGCHIGPPNDHFDRIGEETYNLLNETIKSVFDGIRVERLDVLEKPEEKKKG